MNGDSWAMVIPGTMAESPGAMMQPCNTGGVQPVASLAWLLARGQCKLDALQSCHVCPDLCMVADQPLFVDSVELQDTCIACRNHSFALVYAAPKLCAR